MRRSMLIEEVLKTDVESKATVTPAELQAYYVKNAARFTQPESYSFQSISVVPPMKANAEQAKQARAKADNALRQAKATKTYQDFGLLAEKISEDDFRVNMGDHKSVPADKLPPQVIKALQSMQAGQVTGVIQIESAYTIIRLNAHTPQQKKPLSAVKPELKTDLQKSKYEKLRSNLAKQLRAKAKIEVV
jgi:parvulin-like peptidyl-prolyl isomerase